MVVSVKSKRSEINSSMALGSTDQSAEFVCSAERLDRAVASRKHTFTAEHAEKLMKKHMRKKSSPVTISCLSDRLLFKSERRSQSSKRWRTHAKYADIRHIYIYSLNPELFMLCVDDSEHKNKKYYESYRCRTVEDVNSLCELTASAKQTPTNTLPPPDMDDDSGVGDNLARSNEPSVSTSASHQMSSYNSLSEPEYTPISAMRSSQNKIVPEKGKYAVQQSRNEYYDGGRYSVVSNGYNVSPVRSYKRVPSTSVPETVQNIYSVPGEPAVCRVSSISTRDSQRLSQLRNDQSPRYVNCDRKSVYRTYRLANNRVYRKNTDYGPAELRKIFGDDLTYVTVNQENGISMCNRGPIYLYAVRLSDSIQSYYGNDLVSATNSPKISH